MNFLRLFLFPLSILYGLITGIRNLLFDYGVINSQSFNIPIISVGNLSVGGTGKTPHVEYLISLLSSSHKIATLSRGYGRKTTGLMKATTFHLASDIGDEPYQIKSKFNIPVYVDEKRVRGITSILKDEENIEAIILDDAFQHRKVEPGINILLTEYHNLYKDDWVLPTGNLREFSSGAARADIIIVTKTPKVFSPLERRIISQELTPKPHQKVLFTYMDYGSFTPLKSKILKDKIDSDKRSTHNIPKEFYFSRDFACLLVTGIANPSPLKYFLEQNLQKVTHLSYKDHHPFNSNDLKKIKGIFEGLSNSNKFIVTTEKDASRLLEEKIKDLALELPIFYLPIKACFHEKDKEEFEEQILSYVGRN